MRSKHAVDCLLFPLGLFRTELSQNKRFPAYLLTQCDRVSER